ncbi:acyltransferase family protein [Allokutzneria multivorans]|uniref:Acyltransferase family protein n=1 Tax=Allokutzneria multivorans TaxID=1142134 RepID=A0ABP7S294_9PSEU
MLRVIAILAVVVQHATNTGPHDHPEIGGLPWAFTLLIGANSILIISAYFVCVTLARRPPIYFLKHRLARLIPVYLFAILLTYAAIKLIAPEGWKAVQSSDILPNMMLMQPWVGAAYIDFSYWTLTIQIPAFIAAAALAGSGLVRGRGVAVLAWLIIAVPLGMRWFLDDPFIARIFGALVLHHAHFFAVGIVIWLWSTRRIGAVHALALLGAATYAQIVQLGDDIPSSIGVGVMVVLMCFAALGPDWDIAPIRALAKPIRWLAGISYGIYLANQELGYILARKLLDVGVGPWPRFFLVVAMAIVLGWLLTRLVEQPIYDALTAAVPPLRRAARVQVLRTMRLALAVRLGWAVRAGVAGQIQSGSLGASPDRALASPRPVNHASTVIASPRTAPAEESLVPFTIHSR